MLLALTGAAGGLDAIGYLALGHVFTANMTGNTVLLGLHIAQEQGAAAVRALIALFGFGLGLVIGALIVERSLDRGAVAPGRHVGAGARGRHPRGLHHRVLRLPPSSAKRGKVQALIALSAIAMGVQSAAARRLDVPGIATTYLTGTFTSAVTGLVAKSRRSRTAPTLAATSTSQPGGARCGYRSSRSSSTGSER